MGLNGSDVVLEQAFDILLVFLENLLAKSEVVSLVFYTYLGKVDLFRTV